MKIKEILGESDLLYWQDQDKGLFYLTIFLQEEWQLERQRSNNLKLTYENSLLNSSIDYQSFNICTDSTCNNALAKTDWGTLPKKIIYLE